MDELWHTPSKQLLRDSGNVKRHSSRDLILLHLANMSDTPTPWSEIQYRERRRHLMASRANQKTLYSVF